MKSCAAIGGALKAFYDGELEGDLADEVAAHLETCAACRALGGMDDAALAVERTLSSAMARSSPPPVSAAEWSRRWEAIAAALEPAAAPTGGARIRRGRFDAPPALADDPTLDRDDADEDAYEPHIPLAAERAARLVRRLIPLAAAALFLLATWGWSIHRTHLDATLEANAFKAEAALDLPFLPGETH